MNASDSRLDQGTHARVFSKEIVPDSALNTATTQPKPKAIFLAGQPGAGKGGLAKAAKAELAYDVVPIDPDELRDSTPTSSNFGKPTPTPGPARPRLRPVNGPTSCWKPPSGARRT